MDERPQDARPVLLPVRKAAWNAERSRLALGHVRAEVATRARLERRAIATLAAAACALAIFAVWPTQSGVTPQPVASHREGRSKAPEAGRHLRFADGSSVELMDARAKVEVEHVEPGRVEVALLDGKTHFTVASQAGRRFVVRVAQTSIQVLGATFTVTREAERVHVRVVGGSVEVHSGVDHRRLAADEASWFSLLTAAAPAQGLPDASVPSASESRTETAHARFLEHARKRQYARAMEVIRAKPSVVRDNGEELMLAADAARLSGDVGAALPYLKRVTEQHATDSRAPLAAFTLGRILLFELGRPAEARKAFALTRRLSSQGALAEDALAREVEAAARAGEHDATRALGEEYFRRYPQGLRRSEVQRFAGQR